jgi:hypothetical protein
MLYIFLNNMAFATQKLLTKLQQFIVLLIVAMVTDCSIDKPPSMQLAKLSPPH